MLQLSRRDIGDGIARLQRAAGIAGHVEDHVGAVAGQCLSGVAAFSYGVAEGCFGPIKVGPVNADLLGALLLHGVGFFGYAGRHAGAAHSLAQGLADGFLGRLGMGVGANIAARKTTQPQVAPAAAVASVSGQAYYPQAPAQRKLTAAELTAYVEQAR